jgi:hypothetical protein
VRPQPMKVMEITGLTGYLSFDGERLLDEHSDSP